LLGSVPFTETELKDQLASVLAKRPFVTSSRLSRFLSFIVWKTFNEDPAYIRAYEIAVDVFDKGADFDPNDPYIRNIAKLARQGLYDYYNCRSEKSSKQIDRILIEIPVGNYKAKFTPIDSSDAMFNNTHASVEDDFFSRRDRDIKKCLHVVNAAKENDTNRSSTTLKNTFPSKNNQSKSHAASLQDCKPHETPLVALAPFKSIGHCDSYHQSLVVALSSEIMSGLSRSHRLKVTSHPGATNNDCENGMSKPAIEDIDADYLLRGNYQVMDEVIYLTVELVETCSAYASIVWNKNVRFDLSSLCIHSNPTLTNLVREIGQQIIKFEIEQATPGSINTLELHSAVLVGSKLMHCSPDSLFNYSFKILRGACDRFPNNPTLNSLMVLWYVNMIYRCGGWSARTDKHIERQAWKHAEIALETSPSHALGLTTYGLLYTHFKKSPVKAMEYYRTAERINPNEPLTQVYISGATSYFGQGEESIKAAKRAFEVIFHRMILKMQKNMRNAHGISILITRQTSVP